MTPKISIVTPSYNQGQFIEEVKPSLLTKNKNQSPLVSIITVVYNGSKTLEQTIQSVINSPYNNKII